MLLEFRRSFFSFYFIVGIAITVVMFLGGFAIQMPSHPNGVDQLALLLGAYLFYTQFGALMFSAYAMSSICRDYSEKNTLFYRSMGYSAYRYFSAKLIVLFAPLVVGTAVCLTVVCAMYGSFDPWLVMFSHCLCVALSYVAFACIVALVFRSFIVSYFANIALWVSSTFISTNYPDWYFLGFFDQNSPVFTTMAHNMQEASSFAMMEIAQLAPCLLYATIVVLLLLLSCLFLNERWIKNGI